MGVGLVYWIMSDEPFICEKCGKGMEEHHWHTFPDADHNFSSHLACGRLDHDVYYVQSNAQAFEDVRLWGASNTGYEGIRIDYGDGSYDRVEYIDPYELPWNKQIRLAPEFIKLRPPSPVNLRFERETGIKPPSGNPE